MSRSPMQRHNARRSLARQYQTRQVSARTGTARAALCALIAMLSLIALALADNPAPPAPSASAPVTMYTKDEANLLDDNSVLGNLIQSIPKGTAVTVIGQQDDYYQVQVGGAAGWMISTDLSDKNPGGNAFAGLSSGTNSTASNQLTAAAGKGLTDDAKAWASNQNLDPSLAAHMESVRYSISKEELAKFWNSPEGPVGKHS